MLVIKEPETHQMIYSADNQGISTCKLANMQTLIMGVIGVVILFLQT